MDLYDEFRTIIEALERAGIDYALVGALALAFHGVSRATKDVDLLVRPEDLDGALEAVREVWETRHKAETADGAVRVVSRAGLIAMKSRSSRLSDLADVERLEEFDG